MRALLIPERDPGQALVRSRGRRDPSALALRGFFGGAVMAIAMFLAEMPLLSLAMLSAAVIWSAAVGTRSRDAELGPEAIACLDTRESYRGILYAFREIEQALADAPRLETALRPVIERCRTSVELCRRMALLVNPVKQYLDGHDPAFVRYELDKLYVRSANTSDPQATVALRDAVRARSRQLATHDELVALRDRVQARLELVRAGFESFAAMIVKLRVGDEESLVLAGETVADQLAGVDEELQVLESALVLDAPSESAA